MVLAAPYSLGADLPDEDAGRVGAVGHGEEREDRRPIGAEPLVVAEEESPGDGGVAAVEGGVGHPGLRSPAGGVGAVGVAVGHERVGRGGGPSVGGVVAEVVVAD